jgi:hypothetical protein
MKCFVMPDRVLALINVAYRRLKTDVSGQRACVRPLGCAMINIKMQSDGAKHQGRGIEPGRRRPIGLSDVGVERSMRLLLIVDHGSKARPTESIVN